MNIKLILTLLFMTISFSIFSQRNNQLRFYYSLTDSELLHDDDLAGSASYYNNNSYELGIKYVRKLSKKLSLETGIVLLNTQITVKPSFIGVPVNSVNEDLQLISIPVYGNYYFGKYFYIQAGPILDFQTEDRSFDSQSGIGYGIGIGGAYNFNNFLIYINPNFKKHAFIPFKKEKYPQKLAQFGLELGIGYQF